MESILAKKLCGFDFHTTKSCKECTQECIPVRVSVIINIFCGIQVTFIQVIKNQPKVIDFSNKHLPVKWLLVKRNGSSTFVHDNLADHRIKYRIRTAEEQFPTEMGHFTLKDCVKAKSKKSNKFLTCKETRLQEARHVTAINCGPFQRIDGVFQIKSNRFEDRVYGHLSSIFRRTYRQFLKNLGSLDSLIN